jgi:hypothetical protein
MHLVTGMRIRNLKKELMQTIQAPMVMAKAVYRIILDCGHKQRYLEKIKRII